MAAEDSIASPASHCQATLSLSASVVAERPDSVGVPRNWGQASAGATAGPAEAAGARRGLSTEAAAAAPARPRKARRVSGERGTVELARAARVERTRVVA